MTKGAAMHNVPYIRSGVGKTPSDGGCIMQVVDWLDREGWTDQPACVHPVLRKLAINANDHLPDGERQKLLDLTGRLMGTNTGGKEMSVRLAAFVARQVLHVYEAKHPDDDRPRKAIEAAERWANNPSEENRAAAAAAANTATAYAAAAAAAAVYQLLLDTLDEYDRLSGRGEVEQPSLCAVAEMLELARA